MVAGAGRRQALWLGEDVVKQLEQAVQQGWLVIADGMEALCRLNVMARGADASPKHPASFTPKRHAKVVKVPQYGPERAEEGDAQDHVVAVDRDGVTVDGECLVGDVDLDITGEATASHAVTIGHDDPCARARLELEPDSTCDVAAYKIVCGPRVK